MKPLATANVALRTIDWDNLHAALALDVDPAQQQFVASNAVSLAEAHFNPGAWFRAVYAGDVLVGFVMLFDPTIPGAIASDPVEPTDMVLWRLMIDRRYQRQRLGRRTLDAEVGVRVPVPELGRPSPLPSASDAKVRYGRRRRVVDADRRP